MLSFCISCQENQEKEKINLPEKAVSIFDLVDDVKFLRLGDTSREESLFSKVQNAYFLDSFMVFGQNGTPYPDHGNYFYFDYEGKFKHRFNSNEIVNEGIIFSRGFYADEEGILIPDVFRNRIFKVNHQGEMLDDTNIVNKASLYLPLKEDIVLCSYNRDKPKGLLDDDEYYDFFLYSKKEKKIIEKGVTEVPEWYRTEYGDIQLIKAPNSETLYHCSVRDPNYIIYEMTKNGIHEIDRLVFTEGMVDLDRLPFVSENRVDPHYYRDENIVTDIFGIQRVGDNLFCMIDRGFGTNYLVRKNIKTGNSSAVKIDWHKIVARDYVLRAKVLDYTDDGYFVLFTPAMVFKKFYDLNKDWLQPYLINDFEGLSYSDNDIIIFLKFKPEYYDM